MNNQISIFLGGLIAGAVIETICINRYLKSESFKNSLYEVVKELCEKQSTVVAYGVEPALNETISENDYDEPAPYIIPPEEFGENEDYDTISLTLYSDGVLADDADKPITDIDEVIGNESLEHFGEYEDDSIFVRNDKLKCDYEVLIDERKYAQVLDDKPYLKEG